MTHYDKLQPYFGEKNIELLYMDTDSFVLSVKYRKMLFRIYIIFKDLFDFSNLDKNHELFYNDNDKKCS